MDDPICYEIIAAPSVRPPPAKRLSRRMAALKQKLSLGRKKDPIPLEELVLGQETLASAPIIGRSKEPPPRVTLVSIAPGLWHGAAATLVLLEFVYQPGPPSSPMPKAVIVVRVTGTTDDQPQPPKIVAWAPDLVTVHKKHVEPHGVAEAESESPDLSATAGAASDDVQSNAACGCENARPVNNTSDGFGGITFRLCQLPCSSPGLPPWVRLAFIYKYDGPVEVQADLQIRGTWRRLSFEKGKQQRIVWGQGKEYRASEIPRTSCVASRKNTLCREFSHSDEDFWFSLLSTANINRPRLLALPPTTQNVRGSTLHCLRS